MSIVSGLLNQTIPYIYSTASDGYGDVTTTLVYSNTPCRWQEKIGELSTATDQKLIYNVEVWLMPDITIDTNYRISKNSETYVVVKVEKLYDIDGNHDHTKVYLS